MDASPTRKAAVSREPTLPTLSASGIKRPAPSLLPPFEPLSSSPGLPRPSKRQNTGAAHLRYPTPVPTSSTGILSSSPVRRPAHIRASTERAPLSAVPSVELNENGELLLMGRSSNSSHFQLSANRLVSRVHVKARYVPAPSLLEPSKIEITCNGWNGLKLHCQGRTWELLKGDSFTSETEGTEIMVDVHDARVMVQWPKCTSAADLGANLSDSNWEDSPPRSMTRGNPLLQSSPLRRSTRIESPISPTPGANLSSAQHLRALLPDEDDKGIEIYEDGELDLPGHREFDGDVTISMRTDATESFSSEVDENEDEDPDEENDPIVHSFGPFGADISARLASVTTKSPRVLLPPKRPYKSASNETLTQSKFSSRQDKEVATDEEEQRPKSKSKKQQPAKQGESDEENRKEEETPARLSESDEAISNHVVNQLAFSRIASTALSAIMQNLPADQTKGLSRDVLREIIESTACIGIIPRQGKDAAGKPLESQYYYVPENDTDGQRRAAVVDGLRKPSLRACRKQHKQYYWKRPKTP
ncbi:Protein PLM2 [Cladobotryum mycophilum]|uniref:Protein PLM2 n=1 Tax=Cladobotryum mycophilum TaxID=491253 RepID=A0ABR0SI08_9HYPO